MTSTELRVFISSTFRDLQEEREHLVNKIFPEIRALCRARGVTFTDIDLRWGITEEEAEREGIIHICLDEIDRCRPYFIGILGERYGWTPPHSDAERIAHKFPILADELMHGTSITEMEIVHGVLANPAMAGHAFFYFRDHDATPEEFADTDPDAVNRLRDLKARIRQSGFPVRENFTTATELGEWLEEDLRHVVDIEHPESETPSPLELERRAHRAFAASRTRAYVVNPEYDKRFDEWLLGLRAEGLGMRAEGRGMGDEESKPIQHPSSLSPHPSSLIPHPSSLIPHPSSLIPHPSSLSPHPSSLSPHPSPLVPQPLPLVITADSGLGKSSLVAHLVNEYRQKNPNAVVIEYYVGASQSSGTAVAVMRYIVEEIRERFAIGEPAPAKPEELERSFPNWLFRAEHLAAQAGTPTLIVIDAVNQLDAAGQRMAWLPETIPAGIMLVVSTTPGSCADQLARRAWTTLDVQPVDDEAVRRSIVLNYLGEFHKGITDDQVKRVIFDAKAASPLFLRVVAEELRLHGEHETLDAAIDRFADAADLLEMFDRVLERLERDHETAVVRDVMRAIAVSRAGLAEEELLDVAALSRLNLSRLLFSIDYHLVQRGGLLGFFHDFLRRAVEKRYLSDSALVQQVRGTLAAYFETAPLTVHTALELLWQYGAEDEGVATRDAQLAATLARTDVLRLLSVGETQFEMLERWSTLAKRGFTAAEGFRRSLAADAGRQSPDRGDALCAAAQMLSLQGERTVAAELFGELEAWARSHGDRTLEGKGCLGLGAIRRATGDHAEALALFTDALRIAEERDDGIGASAALGQIGISYLFQGRPVEALEYFEHGLAMSESLGDREKMASAFNNIGVLHMNAGRNAEALDHYERARALFESSGDRLRAANTWGNIGIILLREERFAEALEYFEKCHAARKSLGDREGVAISLLNIGTVHEKQGRPTEALEYFERSLVIQESLGDHNGMLHALVDIGVVRRTLGRLAESRMALERALHISSTFGFANLNAYASGALGCTEEEEARALEGEARTQRLRSAVGHLETCVQLGIDTNDQSLRDFETPLNRVKTLWGECKIVD